MVKVLAVSGNSNSGKTTLIEMMVEELRRRGLRVLTVKHGRHFDFGSLDLETSEGIKIGEKHKKDTERLWNVGADVAFLSENFTFLALRRELSIEELCSVSKVDIVLVEGFRNENVRKVVILDETSKVEDFKGEILAVLRKEDVLSRKVDVKKLVEDVLRG